MTTFPAPLSLPTTPRITARISPTAVERLLLRLSHTVEAATLRRMDRRASVAAAPATDAVEVRRTAQALGAVGILPR